MHVQHTGVCTFVFVCVCVGVGRVQTNTVGGILACGSYALLVSSRARCTEKVLEGWEVTQAFSR